MMYAPHTTPLANAVDFVFRGSQQLDSNSNVRIISYGDKQSFADLWRDGLQFESPEIAGQQVRWYDPNAIVFIVGEAAPDDVIGNVPECLRGIAFGRHLTAASWVAAWRLKFPNARAQVVVIRSANVGPSDLIGQTLDTLFGGYDANNLPLVPGVRHLKSPSLAALCEAINSSKDQRTQLTPSVQAMLRTTLWGGLISNREGQHAVSNVLGALLLSTQVGKGQTHGGEPWAQDYLLSLVQACGVVADNEQVRIDALRGFQCWIRPEMQKAIGAAVLIDDMADIWKYFLRGALGFVSDTQYSGNDPVFRERFVTTPPGKFFEQIQGLPARLSEFLNSGRPFISAGTLIAGVHKVEDHFVLFLDLRLFPKRGATGGDLQDTFFKQLSEFGVALLDSGRNLPWLNAGGKECIRKELDQILGNVSPTEPVALPPEETLLPRLLSLLDPTLPIVIFSSTHHSELIDPFRNYGNIITTFRKPILTDMSGDWSTTVRELHADFTSALEQATGILKLRDSICTFHQRVQPQASIGLPTGGNGYLVEIFFDESEDPTQNRPPRAICAGGVVVIRALDSYGSPLVSDADVFQKLAATGSIWGWCADTPEKFSKPMNTPQNRAFMPKGKNLDFNPGRQGTGLMEKMLHDIRTTLGSTGCVFPFAVMANRDNPFTDWMEQPRGVDAWTAEKVLDATLRRLVQHALEGLLFRSRVLREAFAHPNTRVAIDLGIRDYPCQASWPLFETFGIEIKKGSRPSLHSEDGFIIVSETLARTGMPWRHKARISRARAVALQDFDNASTRPTGVPLPKQIHYLADAIAHVALDDLDVATKASDTIAEFFASGWIEDFRKDIEAERRFSVGRAWDQNDCVWAVIEADRLKANSPQNGVGIDLYHELAQGTGRLSAFDISRLFKAFALPGKPAGK